MSNSLQGSPKTGGKCDGCGKEPRIRTQIESGQWLCRACRSQLRMLAEQLTTAEKVKAARERKLSSPDKLTKAETERLNWLRALRSAGGDAAENTPKEELHRLWMIQRLRKKKLRIAESLEFSEVEKLYDKKRVNHWFTKIAGVSHKNSDGTSRQKIIEVLTPGETLRLERDENNKRDRHAIRIIRETGEQVGFIARDSAPQMCAKISQGVGFSVTTLQITGGTKKRKTMGVNVLIVEAAAGITNEEVQNYVDRIDLSGETGVDRFEETESDYEY